MNRILAILTFALLALSGSALAQADDAPQESWMLHVDKSDGTSRFVPDRIILVPGGTVQLMIFGQGHGRYSVTLDDLPELEAEVDTSAAGVVHVAEFAAPTTPGEYPFHDKHHPEAKGILVVKGGATGNSSATTENATAQPTVGVGNGYDTKFYPARIEVRAGEPILFKNNASEIIHTMTAVDGSFDADAVRAGEERTIMAPSEPGEYAFICKYHGDSGMRGTLVVLPAPDRIPASNDSQPVAESTERADTPGAAIGLLLAIVVLAAILTRKR